MISSQNTADSKPVTKGIEQPRSSKMAAIYKYGDRAVPRQVSHPIALSGSPSKRAGCTWRDVGLEQRLKMDRWLLG